MCLEDFSVSRRTGLLGLFLGQEGLSFRQLFLNQQKSMCEEDVSVSRRNGLLA
jgi:hypothetical protein